MEYSTYLKQLLQSSGAPHFTNEGMKTILNVVFIEGGMKQLALLEKAYPDVYMNGRFRYEYNVLKSRLKEITGQKQPKELLRGLCE